VKLNVGGSLYHTHISTLRCNRTSELGRKFGNDNWRKELNGDGYLFIDRDGKLFYYILNFLRSLKSSTANGASLKPPVLQVPDELVKSLLVEAQHFNIKALVTALKGRVKKHKQSIDDLRKQNAEMKVELEQIKKKSEASAPNMEEFYAYVAAIAEFCNIKLYPKKPK